MSERFNVKISGRLLEGFEPDAVKQALASQLKLPEATAARLVSGQPMTIKKNVDKTFARKYGALLKRAGLEVKAVRVNADGSPQASAPEQRTEPPVAAVAATAEPPAGPPGPPVQRAVSDPPTDAWRSEGGYRFQLQTRPDYAFLNVEIPADETLKVEAAAMATMDTHLKMKTKLGGGLKRFVSGESIFINEFTADGAAGHIGIAPSVPGDMAHVFLNGDGQAVLLQNSAYVASTDGVDIDTKWQGLMKGFFSGEGLFLIRASGRGDLWFNTFGALIEIDVSGEYVVDNSHIVAFTEGLEYNIEKIGGYKSLFFSGEGLVCRFSGSGRIWIQTRKARSLVAWARYYRPVKSRG